eukprot:GFUD01012483.1.p1 GENE.GFUD01012483.1~~GFUD01012483.1.p1  ORF type:complete len:359 (+),score=118.49 GFUD01012483.1:64-1140(+)
MGQQEVEVDPTKSDSEQSTSLTGEVGAVDKQIRETSHTITMPSPASLPSLYPVLARRSSYTSIVHQEKEMIQTISSCSVPKLAQCLAEWLVVLQGVAEERETDLPAVNCRCSKAVKINEELKNLGRKLNDVWQVVERVGQVQAGQMEEISQDMVRIAGLLRSEVSILIPSAIDRAELAVAEQARCLLSDGDMRAVVTDAMDGVAELVFSLLGVENCQHCNNRGDVEGQPMEEIDADIMSMVASMCSGGDGMAKSDDLSSSNKPSNKGVGREVLERSRKRKQNRPSRIPNSPIAFTSSNTGSPIKKMRKVGLNEDSAPASRTEILFLLEKKKKLVKKDGLYKFVLWREALKDEKTKLVS